MVDVAGTGEKARFKEKLSKPVHKLGKTLELGLPVSGRHTPERKEAAFDIPWLTQLQM